MNLQEQISRIKEVMDKEELQNQIGRVIVVLLH
jgi:hypothetical protein